MIFLLIYTEIDTNSFYIFYYYIDCLHAVIGTVFENFQFGSENIVFKPFDQHRKFTYLCNALTIMILDKFVIFNSDIVHINFDIKCLLCDLINTLSLINIKC